MTDDPLSKESALARVKEAGRKAGMFGSPKEMNPYRGGSLHAEAAAWLAGHSIGSAERRSKCQSK